PDRACWARRGQAPGAWGRCRSRTVACRGRGGWGRRTSPDNRASPTRRRRRGARRGARPGTRPRIDAYFFHRIMSDGRGRTPSEAWLMARAEELEKRFEELVDNLIRETVRQHQVDGAEEVRWALTRALIHRAVH